MKSLMKRNPGRREPKGRVAPSLNCGRDGMAAQRSKSEKPRRTLGPFGKANASEKLIKKGGRLKPTPKLVYSRTSIC
jgi:hypothetical protein